LKKEGREVVLEFIDTDYQGVHLICLILIFFDKAGFLKSVDQAPSKVKEG
jgi:hypothetical protein